MKYKGGIDRHFARKVLEVIYASAHMRVKEELPLSWEKIQFIHVLSYFLEENLLK